MKVFVAGASGVIGRPLVRQLLEGGHEVTGMTSREAGRAAIEAAGATALVCDALDAGSVREAVAAAAPEVIVNELTKLPRDYDPRRLDASFYEPTSRIRTEGGGNLIEAAQAAGVRRFVTQSIAFLYAREGPMVVDEDARPATDAPPPFGDAVRAVDSHERAALDADGVESLVLRYGWFYGPGTYYASDGSIAAMVRKRRFPIPSGADGLFSFVHVDDAAAATVIACERGPQGIYNVVDDEPASIPDWLPLYAEALGAKRPWRLPGFVVRLLGGPAAQMAVGLRGASNAKARRELGWEPRCSTWRDGFHNALG